MAWESVDYDPFSTPTKPPGSQGEWVDVDYDPFGPPKEEKPSLLEAAKLGVKESIAGGLRRFEAPVLALGGRRIQEALGIPPGLEASTLFKPTPEEEERGGRLGIPGQLVRGVAGLPATVASYLPYTAALGPVGGFIAPEAAELAAEPKPLGETARRLGESAALGLGLKYMPPGLKYRIPGMAGLFGGQAFVENLAGGMPVGEALKQSIAPTIIGGGLGFLGERPRREIPVPGEEPPRQLTWKIPMGTTGWPPGPETPGLPIPYARGGAPVDMVWNPRTGRYEPGDYFQATTAPPRPGPPPPAVISPRKEIPFTPRGTWRQGPGGDWYFDLGRGKPVEPAPPMPEWQREGREFPPPEYPPVPYTPPTGPKIGPTRPLGPPTPAPTLNWEEITPQSLKIPILEGKFRSIMTEAYRMGGFSRDLIMRWGGIGGKRADEIAQALVKAGLAEPVPGAAIGTMPFRFLTDRISRPGDKLRYSSEIRAIREEINRGEPAKKIGGEGGTTISWGTSYPSFMRDKVPGWTKKDMLEAIDRGMLGDEFKKPTKEEARLKEQWEAVKAEARGRFREGLNEERMRRRTALREDLDKPEPAAETLPALTETFDDEIMGFREELTDEGWPEEAISRAVEEIRISVDSKKIPPDFDGIKKALSTLLTQAEVDPVLSPVARRQYMLPGEKVGVPFPERKLPGPPTLKGTELWEGLAPEEKTLFDNLERRYTETNDPALIAEIQRMIDQKTAEMKAEGRRTPEEVLRERVRATPETELAKPFSEINEEIIPEDLKVKVSAVREKTGKKVEIEQGARDAIKEHKGKLDQFRSLLKCITS